MTTNTTQSANQTHNGDCVVAALYRFAPFPDFVDHREPLTRLCELHGVRGTLLLANEGINGTIAGERNGVDSIVAYIRAIPGFSETEVKESFADEMPFARMKVRLKKEIVTLGVPGIDPNRTVGTYVAPEDWNALIADPDTIVIDTRNDYEVEIGTFKGALNPRTASFREFPDWVKSNLAKDKPQKVAMFCTGGIRCEKATALLKEIGFDDVYHLQGGILKYLEEVPSDQSLWRGECFVFDQRVSVGHELTPGPYQLCSVCRKPFLSGKGQGGYADTLCADCSDQADDATKARASARQKQIDLAKARGESHIGPPQKPTKDT